MASKPPKSKHFNFSLILLSICFIFLTITYIKEVQKELENTISYSNIARNPEWFDIITGEVGAKNINVGLVNMDEMLDELGTKAKVVKVSFEKVGDDIGWQDLFPQSTDGSKVSNCPQIPMPRFEDFKELDVIVAKVPCNGFKGKEPRNVLRLQVNLVVANLLIKSSGRQHRDVYVVFLGSCLPMREIFKCDDLLWHGKGWRIYKPELNKIKQKLLMPVGTCQLAPPFAPTGEEIWRRQSDNHTMPQSRESYVTILHSSEAYVCGAIALAQSIILSNSTKELLLLADEHISPKSLAALRLAGWKTKQIQRIRSPFSQKGAYNEWNYSKLRAWQLQEYSKVLFIDSDFIVLKNLDHFFVYPQLSASLNGRHLFNSGLMLLEPSKCTFKTLMKKRLVVASYNGGDQGFLNEMFPWWHRLPDKLNYMKYFPGLTDDYIRRIPDDAYAVHYLGLKPWMCYRDYDCNWDQVVYRIFASDSANEKWWRIYDTLPKNLKEFCSLTPGMNARIWQWRDEAKNASFSDGHWKIEVRDPRSHAI
ncbi:putative UDP-glucuronate:xylan alpha-glucuronosyltransferase 4 [Primulina tabacum]|uniref:putative UDP-glucuronate:xylan alpha-glucuronosyltransferase 4 n=1 Tax=Primulina tabacum TaxID=48773 RepID=UPI003F5AA420